MSVIMPVLWSIMILLFLAGGVSFVFNRHLGMDLLKRALVLVAVLTVGPSLLSTALSGIPTWVLVVLGILASFAAYGYLTASAAKSKQAHGSSHQTHAERQPRLPTGHGHHEEEHE